MRTLVPVSIVFATSLSSPSGRSVGAAGRPEPIAVITGRVVDSASSQPLGGVVVSVRETTLNVQTDPQGNYRLNVPVDSATGRDLVMVVRRIGYQPATRALHVTAGTRTEHFALSASQVMLEQVVVTGTSNGARMSKKAIGANVMRRAGSAAGSRRSEETAEVRDKDRGNTEGYDVIAENPFLTTASAPRSTFSIDVDHASYSNVRRFLRQGERPPRDAVRLEELINYFPYDLPAPRGEDPVTITTEVSTAPWNPAHRLVRIGLKGRPIDVDSLPPNNLVFLIDVSGSMEDEDKLPLLKSAFRLLVNELRPQDRVALVVYAGNAGVVLPPTPGSQKDSILDAIERLEAGGSTAGGDGIRLAYDVAKQSFMPNGNNRVILATDGDFNVGVSSDAELVQLIEQRREQGTFLTVLGFGTGNVKDSKMEKLADKGNGNYAYVDNLMEARKVLVTEMGGTLLTIAKDVKLQIEFNPSRVGAYRLLGYENRLLRDEDFKDDTKDAGELGSGHAVTALYELIPPGSPDLANVPRPDSPRYTKTPSRTNASASSELMYVKLRYKRPTGSRSREITQVVADETTASPSTDFVFASAVAELGMVLRDSPHKGKSSLDSVIVRGERSKGADPFGYRAEFVSLAKMARDILQSGKVAGR
ncbi:MAG TPA: von Willebrand factor type A domain-containing protein [Gemmatimonadaceae bacterium]|nr:von Willebrand factor type A domain-containing protein [Gemmatimonadaceae bacterium]